METLSKLICEAASGTVYYDILNKQNKEWLLGASDMKTAFEIYQPTAVSGKVLKAFFPYVCNFPFVCKAFGIKKKHLKVRDELDQILKQFFGEGYRVSFFGGTPCVHQKVVVQIFRQENILGYCKISESEDIGKLFDRECENLKWLCEHGITNVPKVLFRCDLGELKLFCQSSVKEKNGKTIKQLMEKHLEFLEELHDRTVQRIEFRKTDYFQLLKAVEKQFVKLPQESVEILRKAEEIIYRKSKDKFVEYGFYHGDFTPWNTVLENGQLKVFDFEYAKKTYPPYLDAAHFFMQTNFFVEQVNDENEIYLKYKQSIIWKKWGKEKATDILIEYLLEIIGLYLSRTDNETLDEQQRQETRIKLLKIAVDECEDTSC